MIYAHIIRIRDQEYKDRYNVLLRLKHFKFDDAKDEQALAPVIVETLFEESGNVFLLNKRVQEWASAHEIKLLDFSTGHIAPTADEYFEQLKREAIDCAQLLEKIRKRNEILFAALSDEEKRYKELGTTCDVIQKEKDEEIKTLHDIIHTQDETIAGAREAGFITDGEFEIISEHFLYNGKETKPTKTIH